MAKLNPKGILVFVVNIEVFVVFCLYLMEFLNYPCDQECRALE